MASTSAVQLGCSQTASFWQLIEAQGNKEERVENERKWRSRRDEALGPILSSDFVQRCKVRERGTAADVKTGLSQRERDSLRLRRADEEWINEALKVHRTIESIKDFLRTIRRPYLVVANGPTATRRVIDQQAADGNLKKSLDAWRGVSSLTDKERDEIEFQVKMTIKRCLARIKELEQGEEVRKRTTAGLGATKPFARLFAAASTSAFPGRAHPLYAEQLSIHRAAIVQYLGKELAQVGGRLGDMQEARLQAQRTKRINLAGAAAGPSSARIADGGKREPVAGSVRKQDKPDSRATASNALDEELLIRPLQADFSASQLTPEQIQQFDKESSALIESLTDDLKAVEAAERKLSEVSELQTQLIQHLGNQAEMAGNLHQEALGHTLEVGKGNEQLRKAKENNRQANRYLCLFLIGSGLGLLFLHWMD